MDGRPRTAMKKIFVSGCYDILHAGHLQFFEEARALGDHLTVSFASSEVLWFHKRRKPSIPDEHKGNALLPVEGRSMVPLLQGRSRDPHDQLFWEWAGSRAVREGDMKLCWDSGLKRWELYNVVDDRTEMHDLAADRPDDVERLAAAWHAWEERMASKK